MLPAHVFGSAEASLRQTLAEEGLDASKDRILAASLPALMLVPQRTAPKTFASQIGGDPWLPSGEWPRAATPGAPAAPAKAAKASKATKDAPAKKAAKAPEALPYGLVAQIPIRDLPRIPGLDFPPRGTFWFFLQEKAEPAGLVTHSEVLPADLTVRPRPEGAPQFPARAVRYEPILTLPMPGSRAHDKLKLKGADAARYERAVEKNCAAHSGVQLFGHPTATSKAESKRDPLEVIVGKDGPGKEGKDDPLLLLSIDGKAELAWPGGGWSKGGTLYYVIRRDALAKGQLDRAVAVIVR